MKSKEAFVVLGLSIAALGSSALLENHNSDDYNQDVIACGDNTANEAREQCIDELSAPNRNAVDLLLIGGVIGSLAAGSMLLRNDA